MAFFFAYPELLHKNSPFPPPPSRAFLAGSDELRGSDGLGPMSFGPGLRGAREL